MGNRGRIANLFLFALLAVAVQSRAQGIFQNLDFEAAQIIPVAGSPYYPYGVASSNALPGWTVLTGGSLEPQITYNDPALGSTWVNLWATNGQVISGNFSILLQGGLTASAASISQTGLVPVGTESILFEAQAGPNAAAGSLLVSLGGQNIAVSAISTGPNYTLYGGDVSSFAGQTEQLTFSALEGGANNWNLDNIQFSMNPIPEPATCALILCGTVLFGAARYAKSRKHD